MILRQYDVLIQRYDSDMETRVGLKILRGLAIENWENLQKYTSKASDTQQNSPQALNESTLQVRPSHVVISGSKMFKRLLDFQRLYAMLSNSEGMLSVLLPTAQALHDSEMAQEITKTTSGVDRQKKWVAAQMKIMGPQTLIVPAQIA